jgi:hypothetical protein
VALKPGAFATRFGSAATPKGTLSKRAASAAAVPAIVPLEKNASRCDPRTPTPPRLTRQRSF